MNMKNGNELKYRVNFMPATEISTESIKLEFDTKEQADQNLNSIAMTLLFMQDNSMMNDFSNAAWVEKLVDGEWEEFAENDEHALNRIS
jgi:hypothetical protein